MRINHPRSRPTNNPSHPPYFDQKGFKQRTLVTSSPYKNALLEAVEKKKLTDAKKEESEKRKKGKIQSATKKKHCQDSDESDCSVNSGGSVLEMPVGVDNPGEKQTPCMFCVGLYSADHRGELWIQCMV
ncbi:hypothetical protein J6590_070490 [Homalodisca vitripennis]|nr:hypothetical protein J6590_070490 [Homalodisca vitripennis]